MDNPTQPNPGRPATRAQVLWLFGAFLLGWLVLTVFAQTRTFPGVLLEDPENVLEARPLMGGLTGSAIAWAFQADLNFESTQVKYYSPLTLLTRLVDHTLYGDWAGGHHLSSVLLHWLNAVLVLALVYRLCRRHGVALLAAAAFCLHPLQVEAVTWLAARNELLATTFALLTLLAWLNYVRDPSRAGYLLALLLFCAGLLARPGLLALPFLLLCVDFWITRREGLPRRTGVLLEKLPFLLVAGIAGGMALLAPADLGALENSAAGAPGELFRQLLANWGGYWYRLLWPTELAVLYPVAESWNGWWLGLLAPALLAGCALWALVQKRRGLAATVGCFLLFVSVGILEGGAGDRAAYLVNVGACLAAAAGGVWLLERKTGERWALLPRGLAVAGCAILLGGLVMLSQVQVQVWRSSVALLEHARAIGPSNPHVRVKLATAYLRDSRAIEAERELAVAVKQEPGLALAHFSRGVLFERRGDYASAMESFRTAGRLSPHNPEVVYGMIRGLYFLGRQNEARSLLNYALDYLPAQPANMHQLAGISYRLGSTRQAQTLLLQADQLQPLDAPALNLLGTAYLAEENQPRARAAFERAIRQYPRDVTAYLNLSRAYILAGQREEARAVLESGLGRAWDRHSLRSQLAALQPPPTAP